MINLSSQLCQELDITYWQLNTSGDKQVKSHQMSHKERELLEKILLAKNVRFNIDQVQVLAEGIVVVDFESLSLIFDDVNSHDTDSEIHLAKLSEMLINQDLKKHTWHKLKNLYL